LYHLIGISLYFYSLSRVTVRSLHAHFTSDKKKQSPFSLSRLQWLLVMGQILLLGWDCSIFQRRLWGLRFLRRRKSLIVKDVWSENLQCRKWEKNDVEIEQIVCALWLARERYQGTCSSTKTGIHSGLPG